MKIPCRVLVVPAIASLLAVGCAQVRAKSAFQDGNKAYKEENFKKAIEEYERALQFNPGMVEARTYLASAHQAMYRPGKPGDENEAHLKAAVENYEAALQANTGATENLKKVKAIALAALTAIYAEEPYRNFDEALKYAEQLVQESPDEPKNLFAMANLYEKFDRIDKAEETYRRVAEQNPNDAKACAALAGFYNKPLWEGKSKFDAAIETLQRCATIDANDPTGFYKVGVFYWDKAYRDPELNDKQKDAYADAGLEAVGKALSIKPDYVDALVYKNLLLRVKAQVTSNPRLRLQYLDEAQTLSKQARELKAQQQQAAATPEPGEGES
jgi:tetratricopeptide (TPR) repeat protein